MIHLGLFGGVAIHGLVHAATAFPTSPIDGSTTHTGLPMSMIPTNTLEDPDEALLRPSPLEWKPLRADTLLHLLDPKEYESHREHPHPRMAASVQYAQSILDAWKEQEASWSNEGTTEWTSMVYPDTADDDAASPQPPIPLYGYMVRNAAYRAVPDGDAPVVLLFPTAVGAQDVFVLYQAAQMVQTEPLQHCRVVIVDLFSDATGWLWDKVTYGDQYSRMRETLLHHATGTPTTEPGRPVLQGRMRSVLSYIRTHVTPKPTSMAALGWCLGGHCIAELARMEEPVRAMITFHGVFSGLQLPIRPSAEPDDDDDDAWKDFQARRPRKSEILICHGIQDPFVPSTDLEQALYVCWGWYPWI
jgi:dienelactone hydrolase